MSWTATANKSEGGGYEKAPAGNHPAVLVGLIDLGEQWKEPFSAAPDPKTGKVPKAKWQRQVYYVYELVTKKRTNMDANHLIAIDLTFSMHEKSKMRLWAEARTGRAIPDGAVYDITQELGQPVLLNVKMKGDWPKIEGVSGVPDGFPVPDPKTKPVAWKLDPAKLDEIPAWVPYLYGEKIADVVRRSKQIAGDRKTETREPVGSQVGGEQYATAAEQDIPF